MKIATFPGTFDPWTIGHNDILMRALNMFDQVNILIGANSTKSTIYNSYQRKELIENETKHLDGISVRISTHHLLVDELQKFGSNIIIRGIRNFADYEYEQKMAHINRTLNPKIDTCIIPCYNPIQYISSTMYKDLVKLKADPFWMVSNEIHKAYKDKI